MSVIRNLVSEIVDYAGLFPPASLPLEQVVQDYADYRKSENAWMLARLILPVGRLWEFSELGSFRSSEGLWQISALLPQEDAADNAFEKGLTAIAAFNQQHANVDGAAAIVDTIEVKASTVDLVTSTIAVIPAELNAFLEIPHEVDSDRHIEAIAQADDNIFAKIRTGGVTANLIPASADVARFIKECANRDAGFKATAGLHHPLRGPFRLTYDENPDVGTMFGYLNVFVAACIAFSQDVSTETLDAILTESDSGNFVLSENKLTWRGHEVSSEEIARIRKHRAISFGSCSFEEPTTELEQLGWLKGAVA